MAKYSRLNLRYIVIGNAEAGSLEAAESKGGIWIEYIKGSTKGDLGKIYDADLDIFKEPVPVDMEGTKCNSWTLNTTTGVYEPPISNSISWTQSDDDDGICVKWKESAYQADNTTGWFRYNEKTDTYLS